MTSTFRHAAILLLGAIMALGHAPAWLHVATCHDPTCHDHARGDAGCSITTPMSRQANSSCRCDSHDHDHEIAAAGSSSTTPEAPDADGRHSHDDGTPHNSETCLICQSLAAPCGYPTHLVTPPVSQSVCLAAVPRPIRVDAQRTLLLPPPRGPPAIAV